MSNPASDIQEQIAAIIAEDAWLTEHGLATIAENRLDIEAAVTAALDGSGLAATVLTPSIDYLGQTTGNKPAGEIPELIVSVAESPANRERPNAITALDAAMRIGEILHSPTMPLKTIRQSFDEARGLLIVNVTFASTLTIAITTEG
jgi:hypothetical protein